MSDLKVSIYPTDPHVIIAGIKQFGLAPDGSDLRDLSASIDRIAADQCHAGYGAENGDHRCNYQDMINELRAALTEITLNCRMRDWAESFTAKDAWDTISIIDRNARAALEPKP